MILLGETWIHPLDVLWPWDGLGTLRIVSSCESWCLFKRTSSCVRRGWMHSLFFISSLEILTSVTFRWSIFTLHFYCWFWKILPKKLYTLLRCKSLWKKISISLSCTSLQQDNFSRGDKWLALSNQGGKILFYFCKSSEQVLTLMIIHSYSLGSYLSAAALGCFSSICQTRHQR